MSNFSKILSPSLRVAYGVLPPELLGAWLERSMAEWPGVSLLTQDTLALLVESGQLDKHVRVMTTSNRRRHDALLEALQSEMGDSLSLSGVQAGMHFMATLRGATCDRPPIEAALLQQAKVYSCEQCWFERPAPSNKVLIGFSSIAEEDILPGVQALKRAWFS